jgi:hypothetical protein
MFVLRQPHPGGITWRDLGRGQSQYFACLIAALGRCVSKKPPEPWSSFEADEADAAASRPSRAGVANEGQQKPRWPDRQPHLRDL